MSRSESEEQSDTRASPSSSHQLLHLRPGSRQRPARQTDPPQANDEYAVVSEPLNNDRFYIERLFNRRKTLLDLSHRLFMYNTADDVHRRECNNFVLNCPFMRDGPHRPIRLNLAASTFLLALTENGFVVERRLGNGSGSSFLPPLGSKEELDLTACSTYVACRFCRVSLFNAHLLNLVLAHRSDVIFSLLQRHTRMMRLGSPLSIVDLFALYTEQTNQSIRAKLGRFLRKAHRPNCVYLDRAFHQELVFDPMSANRMLNAQLTNRCETCLISLIEHDLNCSLQLEDILLSCSDDSPDVSSDEERDQALASASPSPSPGRSHDDGTPGETLKREAASSGGHRANTDGQSSSNNNNSNNDRDDVDDEMALLLACKCCLSKRARVNVPCGHLFQCASCEKLLRRSNQSPFKNAPCPVCRSPVLVTSEIFP